MITVIPAPKILVPAALSLRSTRPMQSCMTKTIQRY